MRGFTLSLLAIVLSTPALAESPKFSSKPIASASLLARALSLTATDQNARPTGQCIYACGDRQVTLKRCADGDCPEYDCRTAEATCRTR